jgi:hypothetical protein
VKPDGQAVVLGQVLDGVAHGVLEGAVVGRDFARNGRLLLARGAPAFLPRLVAGRIDHEPENPGSHGRFSPVLRRVAKNLDKRGLDRVLGIGGVAAASSA